MRFKNTRKAVAAFVASAIGLAAGVGVALWNSDGDGEGRARATTAQSVTVTAVTGAADLYPGYTLGDVHFTLTNPNPYDIVFDTMTAGTVTSSDQANCPAGNLDVSNASGLNLAVDGGDTSGALSISNVVSMDVAAPDACQGVTFDIDLTLTGSQV